VLGLRRPAECGECQERNQERGAEPHADGLHVRFSFHELERLYRARARRRSLLRIHPASARATPTGGSKTSGPWPHNS
jgi:hypothetical protein